MEITIDNNALNRRNDNKQNSDVVIETSENTELVAGQKKAGMFVGRPKSDTSESAVSNLVKHSFPSTELTVEKLETKETNASFRFIVDFNHEDELMNSAIWPKNTLVERFYSKTSKPKQ